MTAPNPGDNWRPVKLGFLFYSISMLPMVALGAAWLYYQYNGGANVYSGINPRSDPIEALVMIVEVLIPILLALTFGSVAAARITLRYFPRTEVKEEFQGAFSSPWIKLLYGRFFEWLFPPTKYP
jgi:hypothetical protein